MISYRVVKFMVNVKLIEKSVKSHVGNVIVVKAMIQYNPRGITWKMKVNTQVIHPAIVEGIGGRKGGGWVDTADRAVAVVAVVSLTAAAGSERAEGAAVATEFRPVEDDDKAADFRLRARDGARPLAMVGELLRKGDRPTVPIWFKPGKPRAPLPTFCRRPTSV
jgi:hypothetical protein